MTATYTKGGSTDTWIFPGSLSVGGTFTATGTETTTLDATEVALEIDAQTTDHTSGNIISMNIDAATGSTNGVAIDIDVPTTLLGAAARVYGVYVDENGKADDNAASEMAAFYATSANTTAGINRGLQLAGTFDRGIEVGSAATDGILISGATTDAIHVSGAAAAVGLNLASTAVDGILIAGACTDAIHVSGATTNGINLAGTSSAAGVVVSGACADGIHISGTNTTSALRISGNQAIAVLVDVDDDLANGVVLAVDTGKTVNNGFQINCTGTGTVTQAYGVAYTASASGTAFLATVATGKTITSGVSLGGAGIYTTGIALDATGIMTDGIKISATTPVDGIEISSACSANAINVSGASSIGLRLPVTLTDYGVFIAGGTGSFVPFQVGIKGSDTGAAYGLALVGDTDNSGGVQIYADDGNVALTADVSAGLRSRVYLKASHTAGKTVYGAWGQLVTAASKTMDNGVFGAVYAFNQIGTTLTLTGSAEYKAVSATTTIAGVNTIGASCIFTGVDVNIGGSGGSFAGTTGNVSGIVIRGKDSVAWPVGLQITGSSATTGILIGACTTGVKVTGTLATVSSRAFSAVATVNIANYGDGYGLTESELTLTGTAAGHVAAMSSWINIATGNNAGTGLVCAQTNGIWSEAGATNSGATFIFGMRAQCLSSGAAPAESYPFSIVNQVNVTTALINCNSADSDLGRVTDASPTDDNQLVPLYKDNTGVHYVKTYTYTP